MVDDAYGRTLRPYWPMVALLSESLKKYFRTISTSFSHRYDITTHGQKKPCVGLVVDYEGLDLVISAKQPSLPLV